MQSQEKSPADVIQALAAWRERLAQFPGVTETGAPAISTKRAMPAGPFTPESDPKMIGDPAPDFALKDVDGREFTLASLRGNPILLDFWATWCEPCREEMPHIKKVSTSFRRKA